MKKIKAGIITLALSFTVGTSAFAAEIPYNINYDYLNNKFEISSDKCENSDFITIQILNKDKTFDSFENTDLLYANQCTVSDGKYNFNVRYNAESGKYNGRIVSALNGDVTDFKVVVVTKSDLESLYKELNDAADSNEKDTFKTIINSNIILLTANAEQTRELKGNGFFEYTKKNRLEVNNVSQNIKTLNTFLISEGLNEGSIKNINNDIERLYFTSDEIKDDYIEIASDQQRQEYFTSKMKNKGFDSLKDFEQGFKVALILSAARYGSGYGELKAVVEKYKDAVDIPNTTSDANVYKALMGNDYSDEKAFSDAYKESVKKYDGESKGGETSGSRGGSSSKGSVTAPTTTNDIPEKVTLSFEDIEGVDWASEAIIALADKKIINGKEPKKFKPNDNITREEFAKIIVGALGYSEDDYTTNVFSDVNEDDWFCGWVNTAYEKGILKGVKENVFGVNENISRQDMCVMLANALKLKGSNANSVEVSFEDNSDISDYAKESIGILYGLNAINGVGENRFEPNGNATRAQAAKVIYAVLDKLL